MGDRISSWNINKTKVLNQDYVKVTQHSPGYPNIPNATGLTIESYMGLLNCRGKLTIVSIRNPKM